MLGLAFGAGAAQAATDTVQLYFSTAPSNFGGNGASAYAPNNANPVTIKNLRTGESRPGPGYASLAAAPLIGDVIEVDYQGAAFQRTFDGKPSLDPVVCAGNNAFSGTFTPGVPTTSAYDYPPNPYAAGQRATPANNSANNTFSGAFPKPISLGDRVQVQEFAQTVATSGNVNLALSQTSTAFPSKCPAPGGGATNPRSNPPSIPPASGSLSHGGVFQLGSFDQRHALLDLFRGGLLFGFVVDDPNPGPDTLAVAVVAANTNPPAQATRKKKRRKHKAKRTNILARGVVTVMAPGTVTVKVLPTAYGRKLLAHKKTQKVTVVDTLKNKQTGASKTLRFTLTLYK